jgi:hypothetical protein
MPTANTTIPIHGPVDLLTRLDSPDPETKLKALREIKNQIIGNRTKKLSFLKLGTVPAVASILSSYATEADSQLADADVSISNVIVQSAAVLGSFACGFDAGVRSVLDAGSFPHLIRLLFNPDEKVIVFFFSFFLLQALRFIDWRSYFVRNEIKPNLNYLFGAKYCFFLCINFFIIMLQFHGITASIESVLGISL